MLQRNDKAETVRRVAAVTPRSYARLLGEIKERVQAARVRAGLAVNRELVLLYWQIGRRILKAQRHAGWGAKVIDQLADDLGRTFPDMRGFSARNLKYMRAFAEAWPDESIVQAALAQITWYHNIALLDKLEQSELRLWYARATVEHGWSRNVLVHQIPDRERPLRPARQGADQLRPDPARAPVRVDRAGVEGPIQPGLPRSE